MSRGGGGGQYADANDSALLWGPVCAVVLGLLLWFFFKRQIVHGVFLIKSFELSIILFLIDPIVSLLNLLHLPVPNFYKIHTVQNLLRHPEMADVSLNNFAQSITYVGIYFRYLTITFLVAMAAALYFIPSSERYKKVYSMKSFRKHESSMWPQITPIIELDLVKEDINKGPWAMAQNPLDFCFKYRIINKEEADKNGNLTIAHGLAHKVFVMQLGAPFTSVRNFPSHIKALFAIFASAANYDRKTMEKLIRQIAASATSTGRLDFTGVDELVAKYENAEFVKWLNGKHAYVTTWMSSMLVLARNSGVVATSEILWLKAVDRRMWYTLNNVGRNTAFSEVAGVHAHWLAERKIGRALKTPMVKQAISGLEQAMSEIAYTSGVDKWQDSVA